MTLVNRLKAAPPHFVGHVKAPAPKIIMRRYATSERTVTPTPGIMTRTIKSSLMEGPRPALRHRVRRATQLRQLRSASASVCASTLLGCYESA